MSRRRLTATERAAILEAQGGTCVTPDCGASEGLIEEHSTPYAWTGAKADQLMCKACHRDKTRQDIKRIAKVRRHRDKNTQADKRERKGPQLRGRGFEGWRDFAGRIVKKGPRP